MIDDPPEEPPSPVLIESLIPHKEWAQDLCDSVKTKVACRFIIARGGHVNLDPDDVVARLERILGGVNVPDEVVHRLRDILRTQVIDGICYQAETWKWSGFAELSCTRLHAVKLFWKRPSSPKSLPAPAAL